MNEQQRELPTPATAAARSDLTFLVIGCQRCGSTWLYEALKEHPEIYLPPAKQTHYFDQSYQNGIDWYLQHFVGIDDVHKAVGEVATSYCLPDVIPRVKRELPDIKIVMVMRNPLDRANSFYRSRAPHENWSSLSDAIEQDPEIVSRGQYIEQIEVLMEHYRAEDVLLLLYDDLKKDEISYIRRVYDFLGVDGEFRPSVIGNPVRAAMFPRTRRVLKKLGLTFLVNIVNRSIVGDMLRRAVKRRRQTGNATGKMPQDVRHRLLEHFAPYNERLGKFLDRDLSHWQR